MSSSWLLSLYPILLTRIYLDMVASIYNRKPIQHHLEARVWVPVNGEARDEEEVHIRFTYNSQSMPNEDPDPITFATPMSTMTHSNSEPEVELENVLPRRTSSRRNATWRRHSGLFVLWIYRNAVCLFFAIGLRLVLLLQLGVLSYCSFTLCIFPVTSLALVQFFRVYLWKPSDCHEIISCSPISTIASLAPLIWTGETRLGETFSGASLESPSQLTPFQKDPDPRLSRGSSSICLPWLWRLMDTNFHSRAFEDACECVQGRLDESHRVRYNSSCRWVSTGQGE